MTKEKLYDMFLDDCANGDVYEPLTWIKDLIMLLDQEGVEEFARMYGYDEDKNT